MSEKVYLAGPVMSPEDGGHGWRNAIEDEFDRFEWINPLDKYDVDAPNVEIVPTGEEPEDAGGGEVISVGRLVNEDKQMIRDADAVLVGWTRVPSVGTPMEILYAWERDKPVAVWYEPEGSKEPVTGKTLSPWLDYHAGVVSGSALECMAYLEGAL